MGYYLSHNYPMNQHTEVSEKPNVNIPICTCGRKGLSFHIYVLFSACVISLELSAKERTLAKEAPPCEWERRT